MKIAASSCSWWHHSLEEGVRLAAEAGFTAYEPLMFPPEILPLHGDLRTISAGQITRLLGDHGMTLAGIHIAGIATTPADRYRVLIDYARRAIDVAGETGCNMLVFTGPDRATEPFFPFLQALEKLEPKLQGTPVRLAVENHYKNWVQYIPDYEHLFDYIHSPNIGITLDSGHFTAAEVDPAEVARRFAGKIFHVHIKDHRGVHSVPLGTGTTDNLGLARALRETGYRGYLSQEIEYGKGLEADRAAAEGIHYMRKLLEA